MALIRVELQFVPLDLFEAPFALSTDWGEATLFHGRVVLALSEPMETITDVLLKTLQNLSATVLQVRSLQLHRKAELKPGHAVVSDSVPATRRVEHVVGVDGVLLADQADVIDVDADRNVVYDSRATRIAGHDAELRSLVAAAQRSGLIAHLLSSYERAVADPADELVHLYEIRDAISDHFGGKTAALRALGWAEKDWAALGRLANAEPLEEGRHRGEHVTRRPASQAELGTARDLARRLVRDTAAVV